MKKSLTMRRILVGTITSFFLFALCLPASAAVTRSTLNVDPVGDFVVTPGKNEIFLDPGQASIETITITNRVNKKMSFEIQIEDFIGSEDPQTPVVLLEDGSPSPYSLKEFITPEILTFDLEFGERISIPVTISLPTDVEPGGYYGAVIISNKPSVEAEASKGGARAISRIGSLLLVRASGEVFEEGSLQGFKVGGPKKLFYEQLPESFEISFRNSGNVHLVPHGLISITNIFGKKVADLEVDAYFALPQALRYREIVWNPEDIFAFGRYTANLGLYSGYGEEINHTEVSFWVIPWKIILPVLVVLILLFSLFRYGMSKFEFKKKR
jgi:hypothetical protein